jgi:hypothetical protein
LLSQTVGAWQLPRVYPQVKTVAPFSGEQWLLRVAPVIHL